jgi:hypothetical protein
MARLAFPTLLYVFLYYMLYCLAGIVGPLCSRSHGVIATLDRCASEVTDLAEIDDPAKDPSGETSALIGRADREPLSAPELRTALLNFYEVHCPEKRDGKTLDPVVEGYANNKRAQIRLNQVLLQRYGTDLNGTSTGLPPSTVIMDAIEVA